MNNNNDFFNKNNIDTLTGQCSNCSTILTITKQDINNEDYIEKVCPDCGYSNQIEIDYDFEDNVTGVHIY